MTIIGRFLPFFSVATAMLPGALGFVGCAECDDIGCVAQLELRLKESLKETGRYVFTVANTRTGESAVCELDFDGANFGVCTGSGTFIIDGERTLGIVKISIIEALWSDVAVEIERDGNVIRSSSGKPTYSNHEPGGGCVTCKQGALSI